MDAFLGGGSGGLRGDGAGRRTRQGDQRGNGRTVLHAGVLARMEGLAIMSGPAVALAFAIAVMLLGRLA